jgi:AraC family transcriptional regulator of adaptative response/methylated-DNA-[protein]-cysteine methyltransferase
MNATVIAQPEVHPETAWAAVLARDPQFDGRFVYAVASTGVYCRPVCSSRRPLRRNVAFYGTPAAAEEAGYRACRRCQPRGDTRSAAARSVEQARAYLDAHLDETVTLERLARAVHMSPYHLQRTFKRQAGVSPREYVNARRAERLKARLKEGDTVSRASYEAGYASSSRVYEQVDAQLGMTPATYKRGGEGMEIRFSIVPSPLGSLLVAVTQRGVCSVTLGDDEAALEDFLRREYPHASIDRAHDDLSEWVQAIVDYLGGAAQQIQIPLDVQATVFQARVWKALREIPYGSTRSYSEIAASIGAPTAVRAVARACASNRVALVVPCHRVIREDGGLGGYRWGMDRKRLLLEQERNTAATEGSTT